MTESRIELHWDLVGEGSEGELREDEVVCEVSHLTYYKGLKSSPHIDEEGRRT